MDTQVSPAVVVVVLILVGAILLGLYFVVFAPTGPDAPDATGAPGPTDSGPGAVPVGPADAPVVVPARRTVGGAAPRNVKSKVLVEPSSKGGASSPRSNQIRATPEKNASPGQSSN